ncbi:hypothetical protein PYW07_013251 [Mythimna separata]|uniref:BTB domain-containing protein n=1 Tax=Mythimna separata TaxID=271217 RepID=A0AAD8DJC7_MYTSE|nr:hypothetical protein PYW07_013251 [Mythimna separata]
MKMMPQQYCLRWKHHHTNVQNMFAQLLEKERFCDVTLYCSPSFATQVAGKDTVEPQNIRGVSLRAHRVVLAACSELLGALLGAHEAQGEPVLVIDGAEPRHLKALLDYMYTGEMNVHHSQLASLLKTAEELRIKGLTDIRWNNKDEPPDSEAGIVTTTTTTATPTEPKPLEKQTEAKQAPKQSPKHADVDPEPRHARKDDSDGEVKHHNERFNVNGGPPPLIKLPIKDKLSPIKRENSDSDSPSPKRQRLASGTEHTDDETLNPMPSIIKSESIQDWQHGNLRVYEPQDISAERVVGWGMRSASRSTSRDASDDEWADAPADIGSFLHTKLRVDGDNSADEESNESVPTRQSAAASSSSSAATSSVSAAELRVELAKAQLAQITLKQLRVELAKAQLAQITLKPPSGPKSTQQDPRFTDVVKLSDYLQHGRRPQFWEENYVRRVMEAVRLKELEMKQAAEILGVSYGTLYGRYRDVYGCINRPYRAVRDFWQAKGPSEVLERLQRGDMSLDSAANALGVSINNLAAHLADFGVPDKEFEPIPIEMDPSLKMRSRTYSAGQAKSARKPPAQAAQATTTTNADKPPIKKILIGTVTDEEPIPATVIATAHDNSKPPAAPGSNTGKWPTIRVASIDSLRGGEAPAPAAGAPASPSALMRTRPDLTIVAARRPERSDDDAT